MSHTVPYALLFPTHLVDALDATWLQEELPDDGARVLKERERREERMQTPSHPSFHRTPFRHTDVPLPDGVDPPVDETDDALRDAGGEAGGEDDRWPELALGELT